MQEELNPQKKLSEMFAAKRKAVSEEVQEGISYMNNIKKLADSQVYFLIPLNNSCYIAKHSFLLPTVR